jgi:beta-1,2-mannobiose phosphorylase / 1,2-beta-oligomannan phosphorylase
MVTRKKSNIVLFAAVFLLANSGAAQAQTSWKKQTVNPVLKVGEAGTWDSKNIQPGAVVFRNAAYHLWYSGSDGAYWKIGYATSPDGISWTKYANNPVFDKSPAGTWDDYGVYSPSVIHDGKKFHLWYSGFGAFAQIGHATSNDGIAWTRDPANPVVKTGIGALTWDGGDAHAASVVFAEGKYKMWYTGFCDRATSTIGYAESPDGTVWTKYSGNPMFGPVEKSSWNYSYVMCPSVVFDGATYHIWYAGWHNDFPFLNLGFYKIGYATSADGLVWNRYEGNPVLQQSPQLFFGWDGRGVSYPVVIADGDRFKMWYAGEGGWGFAQHQQIGYATSPKDTP